MADFYPNKYKNNKSRPSFEPQYIKSAKRSKSRKYVDEDEEWKVKTTKEGFLYFHLAGTNTYQWNFPRRYDLESKKTRPCFVDKWIKKYDARGKKYWIHEETQLVQHVKPDSETYLIQAAILGNLAFLQIYIKSKGILAITDQQKRNPLHHAVSNGHKQFTLLLCDFGAHEGLLEEEDLNGCTPVFAAVKYNETECLKILISYDCNLFHRRRNGDTCLHEAAAYNSMDCLIVLSTYGGQELLVMKNKQGLRPIELAQKMRNFESYTALQKLERNLEFQNAILEREVGNIKKPKSSRTPTQAQPLTSNRKGPKTHRANQEQEFLQGRNMRNFKKLKVIEEQTSESQDSNDHDDYSAMEHLGGKRHQQSKIKSFEQKHKAEEHMHDYLRKVQKDRLSKPLRKHNMHDFQQYMEDKSSRRSKKKQLSSSEEYSSSPTKPVNKSRKSAQTRHYSSSSGEEEMKHNEQVSRLSSRKQQLQESINKNRSYFHLSIRDDTTILNPQLRQAKTARDIYLMDGQDSPSDDEEQQRGRRQKAKTERGGAKEKRSRSSRSSLVEGAFSKTTSFMKSIAHFVKDKYVKLKDYVWQDGDADRDSDSSHYGTPRSRSKSRGRSKSNRHKPSLRISKQRKYEEDSELSESDRHLDRAKQKPKQMLLQNISKQQKEEPMVEEKSKKSISIQADKPVTNELARALDVSMKSVGVGSICVNDSLHTQSSQAMSAHKQQQSRMIYLEKKKRLGNKSKQLIQKNYLSSEEESKASRAAGMRSPSPAPRFMKEEIEYIKQVQIQKDPAEMAKAFQTQEIRELPLKSSQPGNQELFTASQRRLIHSSTSAQSVPLSNQRYGRTTGLSLSGAEEKHKGSESPSVRSASPAQNVIKQSDTALQPMQAASLVTQQQYDMLMLNNEGNAQPTNVNPNYKVEGEQLPAQQLRNSDDIQKFYDDLLKNTSITQINEIKQTANLSASIDDSNLSAFYQKVMESKPQQPPKKENSLIFEPDKSVQVEERSQHYICDDQSIIRGILSDFEDFDHLSDPSFITPPENLQYLSNVLEKGQFIQNSCMSIQNTQQNTSIQRPIGGKLQNNSMLQFNIQYQSDQEDNFQLNKKPNLLCDSPLKKKPMIPPVIQRSTQSLQPAEGLESGRQRDTHQEMIIDLFKEDAENENLNIPSDLNGQESLPGADAIAHNANTIDDIITPKRQGTSSLNAQQPNTYSKQPTNTLLLSNDTKSFNTKNAKKNKRYEQEDSLINFDLTESKLDTFQLEDDKEEDSLLPNMESKTDIVPQKLDPNLKQQELDQSLKRRTSIKVHIETEVLPMQALQPAYCKESVQAWDSESHSLIDHDSIKRTLLSNLMVEAFSASASSDMVLVKREFLQYQGGKGTTILVKMDKPATASANIIEDDPLLKSSEKQKFKDALRAQSVRSSYNQLNMSSQDSILQDLDSISRIYNDLETVQEEDGTIEKTDTMIQQEKSVHLRNDQSPEQLINRKIPLPTYEGASNKRHHEGNNNKHSPNLFYHSREDLNFNRHTSAYSYNGDRASNAGSTHNNPVEIEDNVSQIAPNYELWKQEAKQNRSTATFLYNPQTSSEDESKRKGLFANARPKGHSRMLHSSVNAPLYQHQSSQRKSIKDVSFKSNNMSTHTDSGERLKENLRLFQKNKMNIRKSSREKSGPREEQKE